MNRLSCGCRRSGSPSRAYPLRKAQSSIEFLLVFAALLVFLALSLGALKKSQDALAGATVAVLEANAVTNICSAAFSSFAGGKSTRISVPISFPTQTILAYGPSRRLEAHYQFRNSLRSVSRECPPLRLVADNFSAGRYYAGALNEGEEVGVQLAGE